MNTTVYIKYLLVCIYRHKCIYTPQYIKMYVCSHRHLCIQIHTLYTHTCIYIYICMIIHTNSLYTCKYMYFYTHRYIYTVNNTGQPLSAFKTYICTHTHICRYLQMLSLSPNCQQKQNQISEFIFSLTTAKSAVTVL